MGCERGGRGWIRGRIRFSQEPLAAAVTPCPLRVLARTPRQFINIIHPGGVAVKNKVSKICGAPSLSPPVRQSAHSTVSETTKLRPVPPKSTGTRTGHPGFGYCTILVYNGAMPISKPVRRSVTLPAQVAKQVDSMARRRRLSDNRVLLELIEEGIEARREKEKAFFELAERFRASEDPDEIRRLGDQMGRFVFGE